jgi:hypothetical protein
VGVHTYTVVLFLHVGVVILTFMIAAILHATLNLLVRAETAEEARPLARVVHRLDPLFPFLALLILGFGAWLIAESKHTDQTWHWSNGWILTALIALIVIEGLAGALLAPHAKKLVKAIEAAPAGPLSSELRAQTRDPFIWYIAHTATVGFLGVVFVMTNKPSGGVAVLAVAIGVVVGWALAYWQLSLAERVHAGAASAAGATT